MNFLMRAIFSLLLLFTLSIPVISDCVAMAIESRFKYMMLLFKWILPVGIRSKRAVVDKRSLG
ncbi:hypothetical protein BANRA_03384 [Escherichia coli]|nr:small predicted membrane protein [Escherichia coli]VCY52143.1 hypothetical protein BANRA_03384 [Escherichia coli]